MPEQVASHSPDAASPPTPLVSLDGVSKRYGGKTALSRLSLTLGRGEICGFLGANGGGKTTALRIVAGLLRPDAGRATVLGFDVARQPAQIRARVGYLSQRQSLYAELSVQENLLFRARIYGLPDPRAAAAAAVEEFGLARWARSAAGSLSGGWARRLQLAGALLHSPGLVLLDEPTSGLDAPARHDLWRRMERLAADGAAVVMCTHDLLEAERCTHTVLFDEGSVADAGAPADVAARASAAAFLLSGADVRSLGAEVASLAGVLGSRPHGAGLRVVAHPEVGERLWRLAAERGARLERALTSLEDAMLVRSGSTCEPQR